MAKLKILLPILLLMFSESTFSFWEIRLGTGGTAVNPTEFNAGKTDLAQLRTMVGFLADTRFEFLNLGFGARGNISSSGERVVIATGGSYNYRFSHAAAGPLLAYRITLDPIYIGVVGFYEASSETTYGQKSTLTTAYNDVTLEAESQSWSGGVEGGVTFPATNLMVGGEIGFHSLKLKRGDKLSGDVSLASTGAPVDLSGVYFFIIGGAVF